MSNINRSQFQQLINTQKTKSFTLNAQGKIDETPELKALFQKKPNLKAAFDNLQQYASAIDAADGGDIKDLTPNANGTFGDGKLNMKGFDKLASLIDDTIFSKQIPGKKLFDGQGVLSNADLSKFNAIIVNNAPLPASGQPIKIVNGPNGNKQKVTGDNQTVVFSGSTAGKNNYTIGGKNNTVVIDSISSRDTYTLSGKVTDWESTGANSGENISVIYTNKKTGTKVYFNTQSGDTTSLSKLGNIKFADSPGVLLNTDIAGSNRKLNVNQSGRFTELGTNVLGSNNTVTFEGGLGKNNRVGVGGSNNKIVIKDVEPNDVVNLLDPGWQQVSSDNKSIKFKNASTNSEVTVFYKPSNNPSFLLLEEQPMWEL